MNVYIGRSEHVKKRSHKNFHSGSSVDVFSTSVLSYRACVCDDVTEKSRHLDQSMIWTKAL